MTPAFRMQNWTPEEFREHVMKSHEVPDTDDAPEGFLAHSEHLHSALHLAPTGVHHLQGYFYPVPDCPLRSFDSMRLHLKSGSNIFRSFHSF
ncbi:hypothetical protein CEXT_323191 [Caerostris extrusa]|uniref:Uncharacterized protein n=1 Tax=Caerostris extrusa TaxID=172846 RepID=A0AAV4N2G8_CAEEX|nr:hypothetical protein CEXT_323191 [Caerostris extrusa]